MEPVNLSGVTEVAERGGPVRVANYLRPQVSITGNREAIKTLMAEGGEGYYNYVDWVGLIKDPDLMVLSGVHHYYFDNDDMKNINTLVNLKQLNLVKNINAFIHSIYSIMPPKSNFIGCFLDNKIQYDFAYSNTLSQYQARNKVDPFENGITSRIPFLNTMYNLMDSKTDNYLTKDNVSQLLVKQGFKIEDMTELNGLTYFHTQRAGPGRANLAV
jgi:hypothetical protein